jgi:acetyl esterase
MLRSYKIGKTARSHAQELAMALAPDVEILLQQLAAFGAAQFNRQTPEQARAQLAQFATLGAQLAGPAATDVSAVDHRIPGADGELRVRVYTPAVAPGPLPGLVFFHGGGWVVGSVDSYERECQELARQLGCVVVSVDYRLAPEHKFPAGVRDCVVATRWVAAHAAELGIQPHRLAVGGDSAGGNLAAVVAQQLRDHGGPGLCGQLLIYPATDSAGDYPSMHEPGVGVLHPADADWFLGHYLSDQAERRDPRMSPLRAASLAELPAAVVVVCEYDPIRDEGIAYEKALRAAGVASELKYYAGQVHGFMSFAPMVPSARAALHDFLAAFRRLLHGDERGAATEQLGG